MLIVVIVALLSVMTDAQVAVQSGMTSDSYCGQGYCLSAVYAPASQSINYTLVVPQGGQPIGWWSIAQGTEMKGANYALCWVNPDNATVTISHRGATGEDDPTVQLAPSAQTFSTNDVSKSRAGVIYWSWNMATPNSDLSSIQHIFAMNPTGPTTSDVNAHLKKHTRYQQGIKLDLTKPYTGALPVGLVASGGGVAANPSSSSSESGSGSVGEHNAYASMTTRNLYLVHMGFMLAAWLIVIPAGILVTRYGRTMFAWYPHHRNIQIVGLLFVFIGFFFAVGAVVYSGDSHFGSTHEKVGLAIFILVIVQSAMGVASHHIKRRFGARVVGFIHIPFGLTLFGLSIWEIHMGFEKYKPKAPAYASDIVYAWSALLAAVYAIGFYKIRRELAEHREEKKYLQSGSTAGSGTSSPLETGDMRQV
jgi:hypothetical protein